MFHIFAISKKCKTMKKSTIWILTIIMALTFVGLLYMQFVYMEEMVKMREQHFSEGVKRSLYSLSTALEKNETKTISRKSC